MKKKPECKFKTEIKNIVKYYFSNMSLKRLKLIAMILCTQMNTSQRIMM